MAQTQQGGLVLESGPVQGRQSTAGASIATLSTLRSLWHPGSQIPALGRAAHPAEVSRADVLNTWQQVLALIPLKPAAKAPIELQWRQDLAWISAKPMTTNGFAWGLIPWIKGNLPRSHSGSPSSLGRAQHPHPTTALLRPTRANQPKGTGF